MFGSSSVFNPLKTLEFHMWILRLRQANVTLTTAEISDPEDPGMKLKEGWLGVPNPQAGLLRARAGRTLLSATGDHGPVITDPRPKACVGGELVRDARSWKPSLKHTMRASCWDHAS